MHSNPKVPLEDPALVDDLVHRILLRRAPLADALQFA